MDSGHSDFMYNHHVKSEERAIEKKKKIQRKVISVKISFDLESHVNVYDGILPVKTERFFMLENQHDENVNDLTNHSFNLFLSFILFLVRAFPSFRYCICFFLRCFFLLLLLLSMYWHWCRGKQNSTYI